MNNMNVDKFHICLIFEIFSSLFKLIIKQLRENLSKKIYNKTSIPLKLSYDLLFLT